VYLYCTLFIYMCYYKYISVLIVKNHTQGHGPIYFLSTGGSKQTDRFEMAVSAPLSPRGLPRAPCPSLSAAPGVLHRAAYASLPERRLRRPPLTTATASLSRLLARASILAQDRPTRLLHPDGVFLSSFLPSIYMTGLLQ
jgi:hypothetical protein